ncbi:MAG: M48 family peptidase [Ignavibacteriae bacterium]|nr:MAG: M48 family peptidase [Ignavibacteriota bacterium]
MTQKVTETEGNLGLSYTLRRSRRRTIAVEVHPHGELVVRTPLRTPLYEIEGFLTSRRSWIMARLADARNVRQTLPSGSEFFLGKEVEEESTPGFKRKFLTAFLDRQINVLLPALGVSALRYKKFVVRKMKRRWGSCRADGVLTFNEHLIIVPPRCIQAVVAHELAHLVHLHHGPEFYRLVREIMPDYTEADKELDAWTSVLNRVKGTTNNGARGPVEQRTLWFGPDQADAPAQISLNADLSESAIISGVRPSMW